MGLHVLISRREYTVVGGSLQTVHGMLARLGPERHGRRFAAYTDWSLRAGYGCDPVVDVSAMIVLPRWQCPRSCPAEVVERWSRFRAALEAHERGHVDIAVAAGQRVLDGLRASRAHDRADQVRSILEDARAAERLYDVRTKHGRLQGAVLREADMEEVEHGPAGRSTR